MSSPRSLVPLLEPLSPVSDCISDKTLLYEADSEESELQTPYAVFDDSRLPFGRLSRVWNHYFVDSHIAHRRNSSPDAFHHYSSPWYAGATTPPRSRRRPRFLRLVCYIVAVCLMLLGAYHTFENLLDTMPWFLDRWGDESIRMSSTYTSSPSHVTCHSHNDYLQPTPLYSALGAGCTSVEADVWLLKDEIYVGHTTSSLTAQRTLRTLYLDPLMALVDKQNPNSRFHRDGEPQDANPSQTLVLLVDFKMADPLLWDKLQQQLAPLRERGYLSHFNGSSIITRPITIVASGSAPFDLVNANTTYRDIFYDAPLEKLADSRPSTTDSSSQSNEHLFLLNSAKSKTPIPASSNPYCLENSYFASVSLTRSVGHIWGSRPSESQLQIIRSQIKNAHDLGLKARYWGVPSGWRMRSLLIEQGVDVINTDDLAGAAHGNWKRCRQWFC